MMLAGALSPGNMLEVPLRRQKAPMPRTYGRRPPSATTSTARSSVRPPLHQQHKPGKGGSLVRHSDPTSYKLPFPALFLACLYYTEVCCHMPSCKLVVYV